MGLVYVATLCDKPDTTNSSVGLHLINLNTYRKCFVIESTVSDTKAIRVEVGWLMGLQHSLSGIKI